MMSDTAADQISTTEQSNSDQISAVVAIADQADADLGTLAAALTALDARLTTVEGEFA
jgi:hypothetical protein